ncbi:MAG: GAF domain-containing protein [Anaerolineae bacterium]|nr:GAF domain-containing protein [Anaerolineae bacterium]
MPFRFWFELAVLAASAIISTSLILVVLGTAPQRQSNRSFALFVLMQTAWTVSSILLRLSLWAERTLPDGVVTVHPNLWLDIAAFSAGLMSIWALHFTTHYLNCYTRAIRLAVMLGVMGNGVVAVPLFQHRLLSDPGINQAGTFVEQISPWGWVGGAIASAYIVWSLALFWRERRRRVNALFVWGMLTLLIGILVGAGTKLPFPFTMATTNLVGFALLGYGIIHKQILNPLQEQILERERAEAQVARRTASLLAINQLAIQCASAPPETNLFRLVSEELKNITQALAVSFSTFDPERRQLVIRYIATRGALLTKANELLGDNLIGLRMPVSQDTFEEMMGQIVRVEQDLAIISLGAISPPIAAAIKAAVGIDTLLVVALQDQGQLIGTLALVTLKGHPAIDIDVAKTFASVATAALQRTRAEQARRESEEWYRTIFDYAADGLMRIDNAGIITDINQRMAEIIGPQIKDLVGEPVTAFGDLISQKALHDVIDYFDAEQNRFMPYEMPVTRSDGSPMHVEINARPIMRNGQVSGAIVVVRDISERKRTEEALYRRNQELQVLNSAGQAFNSSLELDDVLTAVLEQVRKTLNVAGCSTWLLDMGTGELVCQQCVGFKSDIVRRWRLAPSQGIAGWTVYHNQSLIIPDTESDSRYFRGVDIETGMGIRSLLSVPLRVKNQVIGVLEIVDQQVDRFSQADLALTEALASTAATAIENARLYEQARHDARVRETLLQEVNHRVRNNLAAILGVLKLEMDRPYSPALDYHSTVQDLAMRIRGLASVHSLFSRTQWSPLPLEKLAHEVISSALSGSPIRQQIQFTLSQDNGTFQPDTDDPLLISPRQATGLAMVLNELTTNSIKHAFQGQTRGQIDVQFGIEQDEWITLKFHDDGPGWPEDILRGDRQNVGLHLIRMMVRSPLQGQLNLHNDHGAIATIRFKRMPAEQI